MVSIIFYWKIVLIQRKCGRGEGGGAGFGRVRKKTGFCAENRA